VAPGTSQSTPDPAPEFGRVDNNVWTPHVARQKCGDAIGATPRDRSISSTTGPPRIRSAVGPALAQRRGMKRIVLTVVTLAYPALVFAQLPDSYKTPGDTARVKIEQICAPDFSASVKPVPAWARNAALERYGIRPESFSGDLDLLIPASLGGASTPENVWPFHPGGGFTMDMKTAFAAKLHDAVCSGKMPLKDAQSAFKKDWTKSYQKLAMPLNAAGGQ
jgi:hypothetical protein